MNELFKVECEDRSGKNVYSVRVLHEFTIRDDYLTPKKISEIWSCVKEHDVLFSDYTAGKAEPFLTILFNPASVWLEIFRETGEDPKTVGLAYITHVVPKFDANGHFAFFDRIASGREPVIHKIMSWMMERYSLRRISCETPQYQSGTIRFVKRLGFTHEGTKRDAVLHKGIWMPTLMFGITSEDFDSLMRDKEA